VLATSLSTEKKKRRRNIALISTGWRRGRYGSLYTSRKKEEEAMIALSVKKGKKYKGCLSQTVGTLEYSTSVGRRS